MFFLKFLLPKLWLSFDLVLMKRLYIEVTLNVLFVVVLFILIKYFGVVVHKLFFAEVSCLFLNWAQMHNLINNFIRVCTVISMILTVSHWYQTSIWHSISKTSRDYRTICPFKHLFSKKTFIKYFQGSLSEPLVKLLKSLLILYNCLNKHL